MYYRFYEFLRSSIFAPLAVFSCGACLLLYLSSGLSAADFLCGAAVRDITPHPLLPVSGGMGPTSPATRQLGTLTARAVVLEAGDQRVALASVDLLGFPGVLADRVRARVDRVSPDCILIGATHTHSAPDVYAFPDGEGGHTGDLKYIESVCEKVADAINDALDSRQPARLKITSGIVNGRVAYNYYAPDLFDRRASVLQAVATDGNVIATLVNYAVHPEVLGADQGVLSPDLVGPLCERIEEREQGVALFFNGAQGGMVTADNRDLEAPPVDPVRGYWKDLRTWDECVRIGHTLADESLRLLDSAPLLERPQLACRSLEVEFPVESDALWQVVRLSPLGYPHGAEKRTVITRLNCVRLGNAMLLTVPGEALPNIGFYLKRKMPTEHPFLLGLTNDAFGYILTEVDYQSFPRYDYVSRVSLGERTGEIYLQAARELIETTAADE